MKNLFLASSFFATFSLSAFGVEQSDVRALITAKEKELQNLQKELAALRDQLATTPASSSIKKYTVRTGDTVHSIARAHQVAPQDLMSWNDITDPTKLAIGEVLTLSKGPAGVLKPSPKPSTEPSDAPRSVYTVAKGDTFYSIARRHKMTLSELKTLNPDVTTDLIAPGQSLRVSGQPVASPPRPVSRPKNEELKIVAPKPKPRLKPSPKPEPAPEVAEEGVTPPAKPVPAKESPTPPRTDLLEKAKPAPLASTIILDQVVTFDEFAQKHGTSTDVLNKLNGWNLPKATVLARGSEINVPN